MPRIHIGIAVQPPPAMIDDPVIQQMMNTYVAVSPNVVITLGRICSGTSSVVISASRFGRRRRLEFLGHVSLSESRWVS